MCETQKERETVCPVQIGHQKAAAAQARSVTTMMRPMPSVRICLIIAVTLLACAAAAFWWPIWTGQTVSRSFWIHHMLLSSWV